MGGFERFCRIASRDDALSFVRVDEIRLHPIDGKLQIELKGDLATLVGFADQYDPVTKKPGSTGDPGSTKWLVAGAHNQRYLRLNEAWL